MRSTHLIRPWLLALAICACGGGSDGSSGTTNPPIVVDDSPSAITLSPSATVTLQSGSTSNIVASVTAKSGKTLSSANVTWTSSDPAIASVLNGVITGLKVGTVTITASIGSVQATSTVTVVPGLAAALAMRTQPVGAVIGSVLATQPVVEIRDAAGNVVTTSTASVTATIAAGGGTLTGTATVSAVAGVATFSGLGVTGVAGDRTLSFTSTGLTAAGSATFTMTAPPTPLIVVDKQSVTFTANTGANPPPATVNITNGGPGTLSGLTLDPVVYDAGQPTGWLAATLNGTTVPTSITLTATSATLAAGTYHATVRLNAPSASNSPLSIGVALTVTPAGTLTYADAQKVRVVDVGNTFAPAVSLVDNTGKPLTGFTISYTSRATSVATVANDGTITARAAGYTWIVASTSFSSDSVYVLVPASATAPLLRTDATSYVGRVGDTLTINVILDTRGTTVGAASLAAAIAASVSFVTRVPQGPPVPQVTNNGGIVRMSVAQASGMNGPIVTVTLKLFTRLPVSGTIYLFALSVAGIDGSDLTSQTTAIPLPIIFR